MASKSNGRGDQAARTHSGQSNRRTKDRGESKVVFRSVLANPFEVKWPVIPLNVQNAILARVVELLQGVAEYNVARHKQTRATKEAAKAARRAKRLLSGATSTEEGASVLTKAAETSTDVKESLEPPPEPMILRHTVIGINAVTKRLEAQCRAPRQVIIGSASGAAAGVVATNTDLVGSERRDEVMDIDTVDHSEDLKSKLPVSSSASAPVVGGSGSGSDSNSINTDANTGACVLNRIRTVLVCRSDVDPPLLVAHIPHLVAACNSTRGSQDLHDPTNAQSARPQPHVKLVSLPKGAESTLAAATGLRRVSVLAFDEDPSNDPTLSSLLSSVPTVVAPWLVGIADAFPPQPSSSSTDYSNPDLTNSDATSKSKAKQKQLQRRKKQKRLQVQVPEHLALEPTHIKQLRTTAPKDMRLAKALRAKGRAEAKAPRKQKAKAKKESKEKAKQERKMKTASGFLVGFFSP